MLNLRAAYLVNVSLKCKAIVPAHVRAAYLVNVSLVWLKCKATEYWYTCSMMMQKIIATSPNSYNSYIPPTDEVISTCLDPDTSH